MRPPEDPGGAAHDLSRPQRLVLAIGAVIAVAAGIAAWRIEGPVGTRTNPVCSYRKYDEATGELRLMLCDVDRNGRVDTWVIVEADGTHTVELDPNEDGLIDRAEVYGANQKLLAIAYDRRLD